MRTGAAVSTGRVRGQNVLCMNKSCDAWMSRAAAVDSMNEVQEEDGIEAQMHLMVKTKMDIQSMIKNFTFCLPKLFRVQITFGCRHRKKSSRQCRYLGAQITVV